MAAWTNSSKNSSSFANQPFGFGDVTWDEATFTWDDAAGTWDNPRDVWVEDTKNSSIFTNQTKN